jgi:hypothetical protein
VAFKFALTAQILARFRTNLVKKRQVFLGFYLKTENMKKKLLQEDDGFYKKNE